MSSGRIAGGLVLAAATAAAVVTLGPVVKRIVLMGDRVRGGPVSVLVGRGFTLDLPKDRWYAARALTFELTDGGDTLDPNRPTLEHRLLRAGDPAQLAVVSWTLGGAGSLDLDDAVARVSDGSSLRLPKWKVLDVAPLPGRGATRILHATAMLEGQDVELLWGLFPNGPTVHGVMVAAEPRAFVRLRRELEEILASFRMTDGHFSAVFGASGSGASGKGFTRFSMGASVRRKS